jgi:hypothetical protein
MNVFRLDEDPQLAAKYHCDKHINKMLVEAAQLLSGALRMNGVEEDYLYKRTHEGHPLFEWVAEGRDNFEYLYLLAEGLYGEKHFRYGGEHKSWVKCVSKMDKRPSAIPEGSSQQPMAMPDRYYRDDVVEAYRLYYFHEKDFAVWNKAREKPDWYREMEQQSPQV